MQAIPINWDALLTSPEMLPDEAAQRVEYFIRKTRRYTDVDLQTVRDNPVAWTSLIAEAEIGLWQAIQGYPGKNEGAQAAWIQMLVTIWSGFHALNANPWPPAAKLLYEKHIAYAQCDTPLPDEIQKIGEHITREIGTLHKGQRLFSASIGWTSVEEQIAKDYAIEIATINHSQGLPRPAPAEPSDNKTPPTQTQDEWARHGPFDGVMLLTSIGYMHLDQALDMSKAALKPGGIVHYIDVHQKNRPHHWSMWWWRFHTPEQHVQALLAHGFVNVHIEDLSFAHPGLFYVRAEVPKAASDSVSKKD